jgi:hypothetical protein
MAKMGLKFNYSRKFKGEFKMRKNRRLVVFGAIVGIFLMLGAGTAMAGTWAGPTNINVLTGAQAASFLGVASQAAPVFGLAAGEILATNDTLTITLTGGLKFSGVAGALTLLCSRGTVDLGAGVGAAAVPLSGGTAGSTTATWRVLVATGLAVGDTFTLSNPAAPGGIYDVSGILPLATADMLMDLKTILGAQIGAAAQSFKAKVVGANYIFTGAYGLTVNDGGPGATPWTNTADVAAVPPYTKFLTGVTAGVATTLTITNNSAALGVAIPAASQFAAQKILVSISGDFTGIASIAGANLTGSDATGNITGGLAGKFLITADKTMAYAVNTAALAAGAAIATAPTFTIDGTTSQSARNFIVTVSNFVDAVDNWAAFTYYNPKNFYDILRNGVSFSANSLGPLNTIKITDRSGNLPAAGGLVIVQAWDVNGVKLADAAGVTPILLLSNQTITKTGSDLAARFVGTAMRYDVAIQSTSAVCTNIKKDATGITETVFANLTNAL